VNGLLRYLLFTEEAPLPSEIAPDPAFAAAFQQSAHRDSHGRSLRDFDLKTRLFKYPCSFLIESDAFQQLPPVMREHLLKKLWEILTGQNTEADFASIPAESRQAVLEILREIVPNLPEYWKTDAPKAASSPEDPTPIPPPTP
jgi:hypothetical protein